MKKNTKSPTRISIVPDCKDLCSVCGEIEMGCHFDHDLAALSHGRGHVGYLCSAALIYAEDALVVTPGISLPSSGLESMPDDPLQEA